MAIGIGLDVGGTKVLGCAVTDGGEILAEVRMPSPATKPALVEALCGCAEAVLDSLGERQSVVAGVGVGLPGLVDRTGVLHETANIHGVEGLDLPASLSPRLTKVLEPCTEYPVDLVVDNDATCAAAGEHAFGAGRGVSDSVTVTLGTGIGGGIVAAGAILHGERNFAAEVGHMVVDPSGPPCGCGRRGCWERFASGTGLAYLARKAVGEGRAPGLVDASGGSAVRAEQVVAAADAGDAGALAVIDEFAEYLALGLGNLAELLDPGRIILGGGLAAVGRLLFPPAIARYETTCRRGSGPRKVPVVTAELGERAGAIGAAVLSLGLLGRALDRPGR